MKLPVNDLPSNEIEKVMLRYKFTKIDIDNINDYVRSGRIESINEVECLLSSSASYQLFCSLFYVDDKDKNSIPNISKNTDLNTSIDNSKYKALEVKYNELEKLHLKVSADLAKITQENTKLTQQYNASINKMTQIFVDYNKINSENIKLKDENNKLKDDNKKLSADDDYVKL
jgi:hypothetical protein